jgi:hypothetical protein
MKNIQQQHGDVTIEKISSIPNNVKRVNHLILANGEITGHKHEVICDNGIAELFQEEKGDLYLSVKDGTVTLTHQEHLPQIIEIGNYKIGQVLEYDYDTEESKKVQD